jgi:hypothetical protein
VGDGRLICCSRDRSVVLLAERIALASARRGTRSWNRPALPRTTVCRESPGVHANPTRGETLSVSVSIVCRNCRS